MGNMCGIDTSDTYPWPSCSSHYELATEYDSFYSYVWQSLYDPHGPVHIWIGGVLDCERSYERIGELVGEYAAGQLAMFSFVHRKNMYRENIFKCEGTAGVNQKPEEVSHMLYKRAQQEYLECASEEDSQASYARGGGRGRVEPRALGFWPGSRVFVLSCLVSRPLLRCSIVSLQPHR